MNFTAIDFETANGSRGSACAVGLAKVVGGEVVDVARHLIRPPSGVGSFSPRNVAVHGIRARDVAGAPGWVDVYDLVRGFAGGDTLVAHNAPFDMSVLVAVSRACGFEPDRPPVVCTLAASRALLRLEKNTLPVVVDHLGLPPFDHHEPAADALAAARVAVALGARFGRGALSRAGRQVWKA